jgi:diguanylate cyclase (GGDEF)-like protein
MKSANEQLQSHLAEIEHLQEELRRQALHDALTGLYNRYYLIETLAQEIIRAERENSPLSIVMADIDHFKTINDSYGHPVGDQFLIKIAEVMKNNVRGSDIVSRYGGEEFLLVLPGTGMEFAMKRAEALQRLCAKIVVAYEGKDLEVTLSFGLAAYPEDGKDLEGLIKKADQALYRSKKGGRNQVTGWRDGQFLMD